jgi:xylulokinase
VAPVDTGDGWGTNLNTLDIKTPGWNRRVIEAVDGLVRSSGATTSVAEKLGEIDHYDAPVGRIHPYFAQKYGINEQATVLCGTGDNPATLLGTGGRLVISLGSSYTVNGPVDDPKPSPDAEYNIFGYTPARALALSVITNGAKLHDEFKRRYVASGSWEEYRELAGSTAVTADEPLMLPYLQEESVPQAPAGIRRDGFDEGDAAVNVRALHVSQALSLRLHSAHLSNVDSFAVVGGGSRNPVLRQMLTDAFGAPSYLIEKGDFAAPLGCAIAAARHVLDVPYEDAADRFVEVQQGSRMEPDTSLTPVYRELQERYRTLEQDRT